jgi:hypothetical protein
VKLCLCVESESKKRKNRKWIGNICKLMEKERKKICEVETRKKKGDEQNKKL